MRCIAEPAPIPTAPTEAPVPPGIALRGFRPVDVPAIAEIVAEALREHYDESLYGSLSADWPAGFLVAAEASGAPVGFLLGVNQVPNEARVLMFAVRQDVRHTGVGSRLMEAFFGRCRARGFRRVTLEVRVSNVSAIRFYTHYRYSVIDFLRSYYSDGEDGYHMAVDL